MPAVQPPLRNPGRTPTKNLPTAMPNDRYPHVAADVLLAAFARAEKNGAPDVVEWDASKQQWIVPSATASRGHYRVWRRRGRRGPLPFYVILECNCRAEQSGSYLACWHKCAVKLWLNEWFTNQRFEQQVKATEALGEDEGVDPDEYDEE